MPGAAVIVTVDGISQFATIAAKTALVVQANANRTAINFHVAFIFHFLL
jgi:hypothetical protein